MVLAYSRLPKSTETAVPVAALDYVILVVVHLNADKQVLARFTVAVDVHAGCDIGSVDRRPSGDHACQGRLLGALDAAGRLLKGRSLTGLTRPPLLLLPILALHPPSPEPLETLLALPSTFTHLTTLLLTPPLLLEKPQTEFEVSVKVEAPRRSAPPRPQARHPLTE